MKVTLAVTTHVEWSDLWWTESREFVRTNKNITIKRFAVNTETTEWCVVWTRDLPSTYLPQLWPTFLWCTDTDSLSVHAAMFCCGGCAKFMHPYNYACCVMATWCFDL